jgi:hypothetical protein
MNGGIWKHNEKTIQVFPNGKISVDHSGGCDDYSLTALADGEYIKRSKAESSERYIRLLCEVQRSGHDAHQELDEALKLYKKEVGI